MTRRKLKFNRKAFGRFRKNELIDFMKNNDFKMEKNLSRYSKGEIVIHLIRLQRNKLYYKTFEKLDLKEPKKMSDAQKKNLATGRVNSKLKDFNRVMKQKIPKKQQIDLKPVVEDSTTTSLRDAIKIKEIGLAKTVSQQPSQLEQVKLGETGGLGQVNTLEGLFKFSDRRLSKERQTIQQRINKRKEDIRAGRRGKLESETQTGVSIPSTRPDRPVGELPGESEFQQPDPESRDDEKRDDEKRDDRNIVNELLKEDKVLVQNAFKDTRFSKNFIKLLLRNNDINPNPTADEKRQGVTEFKDEQLARLIIGGGGRDLEKLIAYFKSKPNLKTKGIKNQEQLEDMLLDASNL